MILLSDFVEVLFWRLWIYLHKSVQLHVPPAVAEAWVWEFGMMRPEKMISNLSDKDEEVLIIEMERNGVNGFGKEMFYNISKFTFMRNE